jgi:Mrp family chromosome partitioning ATPase
MSRIFKALERAEAGLHFQPGPRFDAAHDIDEKPPATVLRSPPSAAPRTEPGGPESRVELARLKVVLGMAARATDLKSVMLVSARAGEGVTTVALRLAQEMAAGAGRGVLLMETGDDRRDLADRLAAPPGPGFSELLAKSVQREEAIATTAVSRLFFMGRGREGIDLSQARWMGLFEDLLADLRSDFDFIVIDGGSLERCADGLLLSRAAEGVIIIVDSLHTTTTVARRAAQSLRGAGANVLGVVLNRRRQYVPDFVASRL